ncbi:MAG: 50S ribosomal protein L15 [Myxococcales bacterium]|nr:50S ribosomal protein L15 [Myxococcales bacterium]MBK7197258.1 50S ribosomal protein L15 [Myxococcales bacterium]MBK7535095.1 50S ribosomal protein L15 [Myxococcales bacterium]
MGTTLHTLSPNPGATKTKKRLGRGRGSGTGKTSGKGVKGQKARPGHHGARIGFEGGQMPLKMRIPKRGFKNPFRVEAFPINVSTLEKAFDSGAVVDLDALKAKSLVPKRVACVKILGEGDLTKKLTVKAHRFSEMAKDKIAKAGGQALSLDTAAAAE